MSRWKVNIRMLPVKAHYLFFSAGSAAIWPFIPVLGKQLGISSTEVGVIYGAAPFLGFLVKPTVGILADHFKKRKSIFLFSILLGLMATICIGFLGQEPIKRPVVFDCGLGSSYIRQCSQAGGGTNPMCSSEADKTKNERQVYSYYEKYPPSNNESHQLYKFDIDHEDEDHDNQTSTISNNNSTAEDETDPLLKNNTSQFEQLISGADNEVCHILCHIHSIREFLDFCDNLENSYMPSDCKRRMRKRDEESAEAAASTSMRSVTPNSQKLSVAPPTHKDIGPYLLNFDVKLKLASSFVSDCLFLRVHEVSFNPGIDEFQKISCLSNQNVLDTCFADCPNNEELNKRMERIMPEDEEQFTSTKFWLYGTLVVIAFVSMAVVNSISDALCFQLLGDRPDLYGHQRLWGAIGWGIFTLLAGFLIDSTSEGKLLKDYSPCFYLMAALVILDLIVAYKWEIKEMPKPKALAKDVCALLTDLRIIVFFFASLIVGMCTGIHWHFLFWFIEDIASENCDDTTNIKSLQGLMVAVQCLSEMPFFYYARSFIKRLGYVNCMTLVLFVFGIRLIIYSYLSHAWLFLPVELCHGITFGVFYAVMATYASAISPPGSAATVQGIFGAAFEGIGVAAGSLVGGILFRLWSGRTAFRVFGIGALIFCAIHYVLMLIFNRNTVYGIPISTSEPEGREMCNMNGGIAQDLDAESDN